MIYVITSNFQNLLDSNIFDSKKKYLLYSIYNKTFKTEIKLNLNVTKVS